MALVSLLLCRDPDNLRFFRRALDDLGISLEVVSVCDVALDKLSRQKYDAVIVDCDDIKGAPEVLQGIQKAASNKRAIALAIVNGRTTMRQAFEMGAHFVLEKPMNHERVGRALRAAHGFMVAEQRRYFRHAVDLSVYLTFGCVKHLPCTATNISEGGMAIKLAEPIGSTWDVEVRFDLPGVRDRLEAKGEFAWTDAEGRAGIRFVHMPNDSKRALTRWLAERLEEATAAGAVPGPVQPNSRKPAAI
jgi:CheY-like chemotaxis protein